MSRDKKWASNDKDKLLVEGFKKFMEEGDFSPNLVEEDSDENLQEYRGNKRQRKKFIKQAFQNTDPDYLARSIKQRTPGPDSAGSTFSQPVSIQDLIGAGWKPYKHPAISSPARGFKAPIPGTLGIADINEAPEEVIFQPAHGGKAMTKEPNPQTGEPEVLAEVVANVPEQARGVEHTTLLLGPSRADPKKLQVWTFFPGDPTPQLPEITMREVKEKFNTTEDQIPGTKQDAIDMGYGFVKHANI
jgi:hypothetical protein